MKKILYIGNNLSEKSKYTNTMVILSALLKNEGYQVICTSSKKNKFRRLLAMLWSIVSNQKVNYILIDTFSTSNFYYALLTSQLARLRSIKYIPILHGGNLPLRLENSPYFSNLLFKNAHTIVSPSRYLQKEFSKKGYLAHYIPNSISINEYSFKKRKNINPKLLWVRAFESTYNPLLAVKVLDQLKKSFNNASLCMVGPDKDGSLNEVKNLVNDLNLGNSITLTGVLPKEQWHQLSENYDIFINTTNVDNMPVSVIEAMALGFPIVSTNAGGLPYLINHGVDGVLVAVGSVQEMVNEISEFLKNPTKVSEISKNARNKAESFDIALVKKQWSTILN